MQFRALIIAQIFHAHKGGFPILAEIAFIIGNGELLGVALRPIEIVYAQSTQMHLIQPDPLPGVTRVAIFGKAINDKAGLPAAAGLSADVKVAVLI